MIYLLCFLASSTCNKIFEVTDLSSYQSVSTSANETVCFQTKRPKSLLLFNHIEDYEFNDPQIIDSNAHLSQRMDSKENQKKLIGFYFGSSASNKIELKSTKDSSLSFISTLFPQDCKSISVSTLENDQINFANHEKLPSCFYHTYKNSTYAITIDTDDSSILVGLKNGIQFTGKVNDYIRSSSELFYWIPSELNKSSDFKALVTIGIPNKANHRGFKQSIEPDQFLPIFNDCDACDDDDKDEDDTDDSGSNYPPKFNYNNIYQNGGIIFPTLLSMILCFVLFFFACLIIVRIAYCCYQKHVTNNDKKKSSRNGSFDDIPPVEPLRTSELSSQYINPQQNIQIIPIQAQEQYYQNGIQQHLLYPSLEQPFVQQQTQPQLNQQLSQQPNPYQQIVYI